MLSDNDQYPSQLPSLCTNEIGNIAACWWDFKYSPYGTTGDVLIRTSSDEGITWHPENRITEESRADWSDNSWTQNNIHVVWQDWRFGNITVFYASSPDSVQDWSHRIRLENDPAESDDPGVASSNGKVYVIWADDRCDPDTNICGGIYFTRLDHEVGIQEGEDIIMPDEYSLDVYPNPFNSSVTFSLNIANRGESNLAIYDIRGRLVKTIFKGGNVEKGTHKFTWDARDAGGKAVSSGLYFAVAGTPQGDITKTLTLIR
jgi:hypothetical protein